MAAALDVSVSAGMCSGVSSHEYVCELWCIHDYANEEICLRCLLPMVHTYQAVILLYMNGPYILILVNVLEYVHILLSVYADTALGNR